MKRKYQFPEPGHKVEWWVEDKLRGTGVVDSVGVSMFSIKWDHDEGQVLTGYNEADFFENGGELKIKGLKPMQKAMYPLIEQLGLTHVPMRSWSDGKTEVDMVACSDLERLLASNAKIAYGCGNERVGSLMYDDKNPDLSNGKWEIKALVLDVQLIKRETAEDVAKDLLYHVNNPSAWAHGFDQGLSDKIEKLCDKLGVKP